MRRTVIRVGIAVVLGASLAARGDGDDKERPQASPPTSWAVRDVPDPFEGTADLVEKPTALAVRVVDQSGRGIPGARIHYVGEATHPLPRLVNETDDILYGPTDEWGRLRVEEPQVSWDHMLVVADGYAPCNEWRGEGSDSVCRLARGEDLPVTVLDPLDRPVANALVGYRLYCGHTPDVRQARTDVTGRAVLPHIDRRDTKWLWPIAESIASEDFAVADGYPFSRRGIVLRPDWGAVLEGTVVDAKGAPVAGAAVGSASWHRGPWTFTDAKGAFRLRGLEPFDAVQVDPDDETFGKETSADATAVPGVVVKVRLPAPAGAPAIPAEPTFPVRVRSSDPAHPIVEGDSLIAYRIADGTAVGRFARGEDGVPELALPAGTWVVRLWGWLSNGGRGEAKVEVRGPTDVAVPRAPTRALAVDASALTEDDQVWLGAAGVSADVTIAARKGAISLPVVGDAVLRVRRAPRVRSIHVLPAVPGAPPLRLLPPDATKITVRLRGSGDAEVKAGVRLETRLPTFLSEEDEEVETEALPLATESIGLAWFIARPKDDKLAGAAVEVDLSDGELPTIDLGELRFPERSSLVVAIEPPAGVAAEDTFVRGVVPNIDWGWLTTAAAEEPNRLPFSLPAGSVLVGSARNCMAVRVPADGPGPYRVAWPKGALEVVVPTATGEILDRVQVLVDGERFEAGAARRVVWVGGIAAGEHRVLVSAPGRKAREYKATWADGETKWLSADLPSR
ncbi:MAG: carboxypeptidase-like regulatory domain-containing protein [Planctomycetota bacterium]